MLSVSVIFHLDHESCDAIRYGRAVRQWLCVEVGLSVCVGFVEVGLYNFWSGLPVVSMARASRLCCL